MPVIAKNPVIEGDKVFDRLSVQVAISPVMKETDVGPSFAIQFSHYRKNADGVIEYPAVPAPKGFGYSAALAVADTDVEACVREIMASIEKLANVKDI